MLYDNLLAIAARAPATSGLRYRGRTQSYVEIAERVSRLAAGLIDRGIGAGDSVAVMLHNSPDMFVVVHALFAIGAIALPLSPTATATEVADAARKAGISALLVAPELAGLAERVAHELGGLAVFTASERSLGELERAAPCALPPVPGHTAALYLLSSGSTGLPKVVPHTHAELLADARRTSIAWQLAPDDVVFDMLPANFAMGLLLGATNAAEAGATTVYWNDPRPLALARKAALETIAREGVTFMGAVPAMFETLAGAKGNFDLRRMRLAFSGGAALRRPVFEAFRARFGIALHQDYGSTEALMVSHNDGDPDLLWNSVGRPSGDVEATIAPGDYGLGDGVGELLLKSSSMTAGYLGSDNATTFRDGWLMTGDLARIDDEGRLVIVGRTKLLIEVQGYKIDPIEVEDVLARHPAVEEAVVIGVRDRLDEQRLKAIVVRGGEVSDEALIRYLRERLSAQKVPTLIEFRESLPRSPVGKVLRGGLS